MVVLKNYFSYTPKNHTDTLDDDLTNYVYENNHISADINENHIDIIINDSDSINVKCSCGKKDCIHIYKVLLYTQLLTHKKQTEELKKHINTRKNNRGNYLEYVKGVFSYNLDTQYNVYSNSNTPVYDLFIKEVNKIFQNLKNNINSKQFKRAFDIVKIIYPYFMDLDSIDMFSIKKYGNLLVDLTKELKRKSKKRAYRDLHEEFLHWVFSLLLIPPYTKFTRDTYTMSRIMVAYDKLEEKEEIIYYLFTVTKDKYEIFTKIDDDYWKINRKRIENFKEKEFWLKYHVKVLESEYLWGDEVEVFLEYVKDYPPAINILKNRYRNRSNKEDKLLELLKYEFSNPNTTKRMRSDAHDGIRKINSKYLESDEYYKQLEHLLFVDEIFENYMLIEYLKKYPRPKKYKEILIKFLENENTTQYVDNLIYYAIGDNKSLLDNLSNNMDYFLKYENYLRKYYEDEVLEMFISFLKKKKIRKDLELTKRSLLKIRKYKNHEKAFKELYNVYCKKDGKNSPISLFMRKKELVPIQSGTLDDFT